MSREGGQYFALPGDTYEHAEPSSSRPRGEDSDSSDRSPARKRDYRNKIFRVKAKNSDDEATFSSIRDHRKGNETDSSSESNSVSANNESKGVINRKKKRAYYDKKYRQQKKHAASAKIRATSDKPKNNKETPSHQNGEETETSFESSLTLPDLEPIVTLTEDKDRILQEFDPLWAGDLNNEYNVEIPMIANNQSKPIKPPRNKVNIEKVMLSENMAFIKMPELKVATMETIQENDLPIEEKIDEEVTKDVKKESVFAKANVSYEGLEGVFAKHFVHDHFEAVKETGLGSGPTEDEYNMAAARNAFESDLPKDSASSYPEVLPVFVQPRKNPWNVWPGLFEDSLGIPAKDPLVDALEAASKQALQGWFEDSNSRGQLGKLIFQGTHEEEKRSNKMIADFFAEEARVLNDEDIAKYSNNIEISKIEIYEEDIKRYHQSLKYHREPIDHDIIFTTVETALNFIEKLVKEREQKKKINFLTEMLEKCLKGKTSKDKENEEEEQKKKQQEENKKKPKMWLVFNRQSKEKVIICTPGEFYDSD